MICPECYRALTERTDSMDKEKLIEALNRECSQCTRYGKAYNPPCLRCSGFKKNFRWVGGTKDELQAEVAEAFKSQAAQLAEKDKQLAAAVEDLKILANDSVDACYCCKKHPCRIGMGIGSCKGFEWRGSQEAGEVGHD